MASYPGTGTVTVQLKLPADFSLKDLNINPDARTASGRITIVREPSPLILGALHLTMNRDFDMDEIFQHLVEEDHSAVSIPGSVIDAELTYPLRHI
jgi:hypothetical protein